MTTHDVLIIGAGAAGLMAAASAASRGLDVLLLEKNKKLGVKILMSGGTRCNITHNCGVREIVDAFGRQGKFLHSALAALPPLEVIEKIESQGVATKIESTGKIFPVSNKAIDVRDALVGLARGSGAQILNEHPVLSVTKPDNEFVVETSQANFRCRSLIITTGGKSYPGCGTTGDGYAWAKQFGHSVTDTVPALVPILNNASWANALKGITIEETNVAVWQAATKLATNAELSKSERKKLKAKTLAERTGSFLFTHWGFSGPSVLDVSREVARHSHPKSLKLICDFNPSMSLREFEIFLETKKSADGKQLVGNLLNQFFPRRLAEAFLKNALAQSTEGHPTPPPFELKTRNAELSKNELASIARQVKQCQFDINGTLGFEKAEVTAGGVNLNEVDSKTMSSKLTAGLYFAGEVLNLDGPIGGFNFQSAFSTGHLAGQWC
ncbi:MAG: NAD(P)/FAD-dependent oxidoreductase [Mariniblastus sp.]|nr:NAD(P)/FAD-dependent oxidoreductase [Mariniblastus sp.]